jgi:hypothetical protein
VGAKIRGDGQEKAGRKMESGGRDHPPPQGECRRGQGPIGSRGSLENQPMME